MPTKRLQAKPETIEQVVKIAKFTERAFFLWNEEPTLAVSDIDRILGALMPVTDHGVPPFLYSRVYSALKKRGVTSEDIAGRQAVSLDLRKSPEKRAAVDEEGVLRVIARTGRTRAATMRVRGVDLRGMLVAENCIECGSIREGVSFLHNITFINCDFRDADFSGVDMQGMEFFRCNLEGANLSYEGREILQPIPMRDYGQPEVDRIQQEETHKYSGFVDFISCNLQGADLRGRRVSRVESCQLLGSNWLGAAMSSLVRRKGEKADYATGLSSLNVADGTCIHLEQLRHMPTWIEGYTVQTLLKCGVPPLKLLPSCFEQGGRVARRNDLDEWEIEYIPQTMKIITKGEFNQILLHPQVQASNYGDYSRSSSHAKIFEVAMQDVFGAKLTAADNFSGGLDNLTRTLAKWISRHVDILSESGDPAHPRPIIGADPFILHLEIFKEADLGPAGEKANPNGVLGRTLERLENDRIAREEQHRQWQIERGIKIEELQAMTFPSPSTKFVPTIPEGASIQQIVTYDDLQAEGDLMKHCVAGYAGGASQGRSFIFHVGQIAPGGATLDLSPEGKVNQFKSYHNKPAAEDLRRLVREWLALPKTK